MLPLYWIVLTFLSTLSGFAGCGHPDPSFRNEVKTYLLAHGEAVRSAMQLLLLGETKLQLQQTILEESRTETTTLFKRLFESYARDLSDLPTHALNAAAVAITNVQNTVDRYYEAGFLVVVDTPWASYRIFPLEYRISLSTGAVAFCVLLVVVALLVSGAGLDRLYLRLRKAQAVRTPSSVFVPPPAHVAIGPNAARGDLAELDDSSKDDSIESAGGSEIGLEERGVLDLDDETGVEEDNILENIVAAPHDTLEPLEGAAPIDAASDGLATPVPFCQRRSAIGTQHDGSVVDSNHLENISAIGPTVSPSVAVVTETVEESEARQALEGAVPAVEQSVGTGLCADLERDEEQNLRSVPCPVAEGSKPGSVFSPEAAALSGERDESRLQASSAEASVTETCPMVERTAQTPTYVVTKKHSPPHRNPSCFHFRPGQVIQVLAWGPDQWATGVLDGKVGIFPRFFVDPLPPPPTVLVHPPAPVTHSSAPVIHLRTSGIDTPKPLPATSTDATVRRVLDDTTNTSRWVEG